MTNQTPTATPVVTNTTHSVTLDLNGIADQLIPAISRALHNRHHRWRFRLIGMMPPGSDHYLKHLQALTTAPGIQDALCIDLHPDDADILADELEEASIEPELCIHGDEKYAAPGFDLCADHLRALDRAADGG